MDAMNSLALMNSSLLNGFAFATLLPRLPSLWNVASRFGKRAIAAQLVALVVMQIYKRRSEKLLERIPSALIPSMAVGALCSDFATKKLFPTYHRLARVVLYFVLSVGMVPNIYEAIDGGWESITEGEADVPALLAMQLGMCLNQIRASTVILLMLTGGEAFEEYSLQRAGDSLHSLLEMSPGKAHIMDAATSDIRDVDATDVKKGDVLVVKQGEQVPVDGLLANDQQATLDESLLTGEGVPVMKQPNDSILGGSRNKGTPFRVIASGSYEDSIVSLMKAKLKDALERKANIELESKKVVLNFTSITLALAGLSCLMSDLKRANARKMWETVLSVLMSATPCPAGIGVPIAMLSGMSLANRRFGATVKSGGAIEALAKTDCIVIDKTGTLTNGKPIVCGFHYLSVEEQRGERKTLSRAKILQLVSSLEKYSTHPLGNAVVQYARKELQNGESILLDISNIDEKDGRGMMGETEEHFVRIGSLDFCEIQVDGLVETLNDDELEAYFGIYDKKQGNKLLAKGKICFIDYLRPSAKPLIQRLNGLGIEVIMLSGDRSKHLEKVAKELGITSFKSCWPHEKAVMVKQLREQQGKTVLMVGDGANDSAALAEADVGMCIGSSNLASDSATVVLMNQDLQNVVNLIEMSRHVVHIAKSTVKYGMLVSIVQMVVASMGLASPFVSAVMQECVDLSSVLHALRALNF